MLTFEEEHEGEVEEEVVHDGRRPSQTHCHTVRVQEMPATYTPAVN